MDRARFHRKRLYADEKIQVSKRQRIVVSHTRTPVAFVFKIFIKIQRHKLAATRIQTRTSI